MTNTFTYSHDNGRHQVVSPTGNVIATGDTVVDAQAIVTLLNEAANLNNPVQFVRHGHDVQSVGRALAWLQQ